MKWFQIVESRIRVVPTALYWQILAKGRWWMLLPTLSEAWEVCIEVHRCTKPRYEAYKLSQLSEHQLTGLKEPKISEKSDVFSLGCTMFEVCELRRAYNTPKKHFVPQMVGNYSNDLKQLITDCMAINPADRPTISELHKRFSTLDLPRKMLRGDFDTPAARPPYRTYENSAQNNRRRNRTIQDTPDAVQYASPKSNKTRSDDSCTIM
jgi:serine/threonine protein kinase